LYYFTKNDEAFVSAGLRRGGIGLENSSGLKNARYAIHGMVNQAIDADQT
jgi:hypothetical protein